MKRVLFALGTRPEAVKLAPIYRVMKGDPRFDVQVCLTGQHRDILDQMIAFFEIQTDYDLSVMQPGQDLFEVTSKVLLGMRDVFAKAKPDVVLVQGDTTTVMAVSLAAFYLNIPVGHVEAGLRTWDLRNPFPEEMNRWVADAISSIHFAPTESSKEALLKCGIKHSTIYVTGNTVIDALFLTLDQLKNEPFHELDLTDMPRKILLTTHRRESFGEPIRNTFRGVNRIVEKYPDVHIVYPMHPNPNVRAAVDEILVKSDRVHVIAPQPYAEFIKLMRDCDIVLTDSGGVQEEAPSLGKPVLVLRESTERYEGVAAGTAKLIGTNPHNIETELSHLLDDPNAYNEMAEAKNPYGDGKSAHRIAHIIANA